jgi:hypothetical protein
MAIPCPAARVEEERERPARKEVNPMAHVEQSNRGFERERYYRDQNSRDHKDHSKDSSADRRDW